VHLLRYDDEIRDPAAFGVPGVRRGATRAQPRELAMARRLIEGMVTTWSPARYRDSYRRDLLRLVKQRSRKGARKSPPPAAAPEAEEPRVLDLMAALERSVGGRRHSTGPVGRRSTKASKALHRRSA